MTLPLLFLQAQLASLSGTVVNSVTGEPVNRVEILAESDKYLTSRVPLAVSNSSGSFLFTGLLPGRYRLKGIANGYVDTYHGAAITLAAGEDLKGLRLNLQPPGVIAGTVRDADGEPLVRSIVTLYRQTYENGRRRISPTIDGIDDVYTDDRGEYRIAGLPPGTYFVRASPKSNSATEGDNRSPNPVEVLLPSQYPRAVEIGPGIKATGIDIVLTRSRTVHMKGHATAPAGSNLTSVYLKSDEAGDFDPRIVARREPNGDFDIRGVPPGSYRLVAVARTPATPSSNYLDLILSQRQYQSSIPIVVGDAPLEGLRLAVTVPAIVTGSIAIEEQRKLVGGSSISFDDGVNERVQMPIKSDLTFSAVLPKGRYGVFVHTQDLVIRSVDCEGRNILHEGLTVSDTAPIRLEIVLAPDGGRVEGVVTGHEDKPVEGATVVLVPARERRFHAPLFRESETDQHGRYSIANIPPGEYSLFSWSKVEHGIWWDPEFLQAHEAKGQPVKIAPRAAEVKLLRADP